MARAVQRIATALGKEETERAAFVADGTDGTEDTRAAVDGLAAAYARTTVEGVAVEVWAVGRASLLRSLGGLDGELALAVGRRLAAGAAGARLVPVVVRLDRERWQVIALPVAFVSVPVNAPGGVA